MNKICLITGDHPRHKFFAEELISTGLVCSWVIEEREELIPAPPAEINLELKQLFVHHFNERHRIEHSFFHLDYKNNLIPIYKVDKINLNSENTIKFIKQFNPKLVISYGCHMLDNKFLNSMSADFWNTHGGLSPQYRGTITHFWPSYFLEPQMTGMTLHQTSSHLDAGEIIFQTAAPMIAGDTLHQLAARNVKYYVEQLKCKLLNLNMNKIPKGYKQKNYGRVFKSSDWRPEHLKLIYEVYEDRIVDAVLNGQITGKEPKLISIF